MAFQPFIYIIKVYPNFCLSCRGETIVQKINLLEAEYKKRTKWSIKDNNDSSINHQQTRYPS